MIFSKKTDMKLAQLRIEEYSASKRQTKEVWLLRESSVPGLLTITYFSHEKSYYFHQRIGIVDDQWRNAPKDKAQAIEFTTKATQVFKDKLPEDGLEKLFKLLDACGFKLENQIIPTPGEATSSTEYSGYFTEYDNDPNQPTP